MTRDIQLFERRTKSIQSNPIAFYSIIRTVLISKPTLQIRNIIGKAEDINHCNKRSKYCMTTFCYSYIDKKKSQLPNRRQKVSQLVKNDEKNSDISFDTKAHNKTNTRR